MACIIFQNIFWLVQYATGYHPRPVALPTTDGASLNKTTCTKTTYSLQEALIKKASNLSRILIEARNLSTTVGT